MIAQPDKELSPSRLAMWRSLVALAYVDGVLSESEREMLVDYINANHIVSAQHHILDDDLKNGVELNDVYPGITDIIDRAALLNMGRILFYKDGDFSAAEQKVYDEIHRDQERAVDFHKVEEAAHKMDEDYEFQALKERLDDYNNAGLVLRIIHYIKHMAGFNDI